MKQKSIWEFVDISTVSELYLNKKMSIMSIAKELGYSYKVIRKCLLNHLIPIRKKNTDGLHFPTEETKRKLSISKLGNKNPNWRGKSVTEKSRKMARERIDRVLHRPEIWKKSSVTRILKGLSKGKNNPMSREEVVKKWINSNNLQPNKPEKILKIVLDEICPDHYELNVKGEHLILEGKIPDFVDLHNKSIVEMYGDYWHKDDNENDRIEEFAKHGYSTLIIWESELKNLDKVKDKILKFIYGKIH